MTLDVLRPQELSAVDLDAWRAIQAQEPDLRSPYLAPEWMLALQQAGGPDARSGRVVVAREGGEAVAFFPVRVTPASALPPGAPLCDYQGVVARPGCEPRARDLARALRVGRIDLHNTLAEPPTFAPHLRGECPSHLLDLTGGFDAYAARRKAAGSGILGDTAKKLRKLEREVGPVRFTPLSTSAEDWATAFAWKRAQYRSTSQTDIFATPWTMALLDHLREAGDDRFGLRFFTLHAGERLLATHIALQNGPVLHAWFIAHDDAMQKYSPGVALIVEILRWAAERGVTEVDLGPGDYRFKTSLATGARRLGHGFVGPVSAAMAGRWAQYGVRRAAEALPLGRFSHLPGKAMRRVDLWRGLHQG